MRRSVMIPILSRPQPWFVRLRPLFGMDCCLDQKREAFNRAHSQDANLLEPRLRGNFLPAWPVLRRLEILAYTPPTHKTGLADNTGNTGLLPVKNTHPFIFRRNGKSAETIV